MAEITASEKLMELAFKGLDHGIYSIKDGDGPLIPFIMIQTKGEIEMKRFLAETLEHSLLQARKHIANLTNELDCVVLVYDGMLTIQGAKYDAIMVDSFDITDNKGYCFAQRYKPKKFLSKFKEIGNAAFVGEIESLLEHK
ncbi:hypothetical protein AWW67_08510 [Roseivirga seohaensis]|uniref:Uncharacterized protein n=1 Tax=Roseivirga seohaensis TaxID=1914963 RepID=A0A150XQ77_9BACT|nr:hypothetical protein [Roseivirga seohaensis]KYG80854.1 hypothetical protein AWW67_08510 [Roseivirga seohaensis]|tara:strand:- start:412 stop:834 length:423 start_codon:yes stop_codon:yes gene_type:complete